MKGKIGDKQRILHMLDAITEIEDYTKEADLNTFPNNSMMRFATIKQMEIIGELLSILRKSQDQNLLMSNGDK